MAPSRFPVFQVMPLSVHVWTALVGMSGYLKRVWWRRHLPTVTGPIPWVGDLRLYKMRKVSWTLVYTPPPAPPPSLLWMQWDQVLQMPAVSLSQRVNASLWRLSSDYFITASGEGAKTPALNFWLCPRPPRRSCQRPRWQRIVNVESETNHINPSELVWKQEESMKRFQNPTLLFPSFQLHMFSTAYLYKVPFSQRQGFLNALAMWLAGVGLGSSLPFLPWIIPAGVESNLWTHDFSPALLFRIPLIY